MKISICAKNYGGLTLREGNIITIIQLITVIRSYTPVSKIKLIKELPQCFKTTKQE